LALIAPASAQDRTKSAEPKEIVVTGTRDRDQQITKFVDALTPSRVGGQLSRFEDAACPQAMGLTPNQNSIVVDRMRSVAKAAGIPVGKADCRPNVFVIVTQDKAALVRKIRDTWTDPLGNRVKVPKQSDPAAVLHREGLVDANGIAAGVKREDGTGRSGYYAVEMGNGSSRIRANARPHFLASVMVVEPEALSGLTTMQLADYAAMRLLAKTDPSRLEKSTAPSILRILSAPMDSEVPISLTQWDFGFLKSLYGSMEGRYASQQRSEMQQLMQKDFAKAQPSEKK